MSAADPPKPPPSDLVPAPAAEDDDLTRVVRREDFETRVLRRSTAPETGQTNAFATLAPIQTEGRTQPGLDASDEGASKQVGRYRVLEKLGRGGMATVFKAHDPGIGRDVAIKFLHAQLCEDEEYRGRFLREAKAAGRLSHPNIVTIHDVGEIEGRPYIAMELLSGRPLSELLEGGKPMPLRDVVIIGIQLARALDYAHARGVIHRDIKPGNIALLEGGNTIKVMDFGIAHMEASGAAEQHTRVGDVLGTPQYMSPEQTRGEKLDGRSDLFSAGIILYQMLAGARPFQGGSMVAVALKIAQEPPPPLEKARPDAPLSLRRIVDRCLAKAPEQRLQSGRELSDALGGVLRQLDDFERQKEQPRIVPLRIKWAVTMGLIVAIVMGLVASVITHRQYDAMMGQVSDNGAALARFIAAQNAEAAVLGDQWPGVEIVLQHMMKTGDFQSIKIVDKQGIVRAADDAALVDQPYRPGASEVIERRANDIVLTRSEVNGESILGFEAPITYDGEKLGRVVLGLEEAPLVRVAHLSMTLMAILVAVTVAAVAVAMYFVAAWFSRPIKVLRKAMDEVAQGHLDHRIAETRTDEFGLLYAAFDRMAQANQDARLVGSSSPNTDARTSITQMASSAGPSWAGESAPTAAAEPAVVPPRKDDADA